MSNETNDRRLWPAAALWLVLCAAGSGALVRYQGLPGAFAPAPARWPAASALSAPSGRGVLVVFLHPRCACSRATVDSLAWLLSRGAGRFTAYAVFYDPPEFAGGLASSGLWRAAAAIPGVTVVADPGGRESLRFGAETSGQALLFGAEGRLLYRGGVTGARGHFGDNAGRDAVLALSAGRPGLASASVFGCSLRGDHG